MQSTFCKVHTAPTALKPNPLFASACASLVSFHSKRRYSSSFHSSLVFFASFYFSLYFITRFGLPSRRRSRRPHNVFRSLRRWYIQYVAAAAAAAVSTWRMERYESCSSRKSYMHHDVLRNISPRTKKARNAMGKGQRGMHKKCNTSSEHILFNGEGALGPSTPFPRSPSSIENDRIFPNEETKFDDKETLLQLSFQDLHMGRKDETESGGTSKWRRSSSSRIFKAGSFGVHILYT